MLVLVACQPRLQIASHSWDEPKPRLINDKGTHAPKVHLLSEQPTSDRKEVTRWKISPPDLPTAVSNLSIPSREGFISSVGNQESQTVVDIARQYLGIPYRFGGETPEEGFDCSGLVQYVFARKGIRLTRLAHEQFMQGKQVSREALQPGDLVFFSISGQGVDHVGIYAGDQLFIHAPRTGRVVSFARLDSAYFSSRFQGARRID